MCSSDLLEWLARNSARNYPFKEDVNLLDTTGTYRLPQDFLVDFIMTITIGGPVTTETRFYVNRLTVFGGVATAQIYDENDNIAASFTIVQSTHTRYEAYPLQTFGLYERAQGKAVVGEAFHLFDGPDGRYDFEYNSTHFEDTVVLPNLRAVTSLTKLTEFGNQPLLDGHVRLEEGTNVRLTVDLIKNSIRIDAIAGEGLGPECPCPEPDPYGGSPGPITSINGIIPDDDLNINLRGIGGIKLEPMTNGLRIINTESSLCCDCEDIDLLLDRHQELIETVRELQCVLAQATILESPHDNYAFLILEHVHLLDSGIIDVNGATVATF